VRRCVSARALSGGIALRARFGKHLHQRGHFGGELSGKKAESTVPPNEDLAGLGVQRDAERSRLSQ